MRALISAVLVGGVLGATPPAKAQEDQGIPEDFPQFTVPGKEAQMATLRRLYWLHYEGSGPKATLWDDWLPAPSLWPALETRNALRWFRQEWSRVLSNRVIDDDGYVATHQHASIAHPLGWPFPFWRQGKNTWGWHFSLHGVPPGWHATEERTQEQWTLEHGRDDGIHDLGWHIELTQPETTITTPPIDIIDTFEAPFLQMRWKATGLGNAQPFVEWTSPEDPAFGPERRMYFEAVESADYVHMVIPVYKHPRWQGKVKRMRIHFNNEATGGVASVQALFTVYDTRHNINNTGFVEGCAKYFFWTRDLSFLRNNINRMRTALRYMMTEFDTEKEDVVVTRWVGHDGRSGLQYDDAGNKTVLHGRGIGNNYWDLLPFGHQDAYATIRYYDALRQMAAVEQAIADHPGWNVAVGALAFKARALERHAEQVKRAGNRVFWNNDTKRFIPSVDIDGNTCDYGLTFLNLEAVYYGFATKRHAKAILDWVCGDRIVESDTSQGADIYHWRFGPRSTTKRNIEYYFWAWTNPESIEWGGQVQDGGAVLGWSYHDLMARLMVRGPENVEARLDEIIAWFNEVTEAGGYRKYYDGSREGSLQGGGTPGGLGVDHEFFESVLVPQIVLDGFLGFRPTADGCRLVPRLPADWPELTVNRIYLHNAILTVRATHDEVRVEVDKVHGDTTVPLEVVLTNGDGDVLETASLQRTPGSVVTRKLR